MNELKGKLDECQGELKRQQTMSEEAKHHYERHIIELREEHQLAKTALNNEHKQIVTLIEAESESKCDKLHKQLEKSTSEHNRIALGLQEELEQKKVGWSPSPYQKKWLYIFNDFDLFYFEV